MTNQLETAKEWLSDLNKIIDKTDNERTKERRDVLEWLVESVEELEKQSHGIELNLLNDEVVRLEKQNQRYKQALEEIIDMTNVYSRHTMAGDACEKARNALKGESQ